MTSREKREELPQRRELDERQNERPPAGGSCRVGGAVDAPVRRPFSSPCSMDELIMGECAEEAAARGEDAERGRGEDAERGQGAELDEDARDAQASSVDGSARMPRRA